MNKKIITICVIAIILLSGLSFTTVSGSKKQKYEEEPLLRNQLETKPGFIKAFYILLVLVLFEIFDVRFNP